MAYNIKRVNITVAVILVALAGGISSLFAASTINSHRTEEERLDSIEKNLPYLEKKVLSTLLFGGSSPISFTGEARLKGQYHRFTIYPDFLGPHLKTVEGTDIISGDRCHLQINGGVRLGMIVQPGRNTTLWSRIGFSSKFPGNRVHDVSGEDFTETQSHHFSNNRPAAIFEDMCAGIAIRIVPVSFWLKLGSIIWTEASPFTIWKAEPRAFAWEYLEYEEEQPISEYFESNVAKGEKTGRAAWHKKAFNGINLESINLPLDFYFNLLYVRFPEYDVFEREYMDLACDLGYAAEEDNPIIVETGIGDSYRHMFHTRLAKKIKNLTLGLNYNAIDCSDDVIYAQNPYGIYFNSMFNIDNVQNYPHPMWATESIYLDSIGDTLGIGSSVPLGYVGNYDSIPLDCGKGFYKEPKVFSIDLRGNLGSHFSIHTDIGVSRIDTTWIWADTVLTNREKYPLTVKKKEKTSSDFIPAVYTNVGFDSKVAALAADLAYISRGFYSPFSFAAPMDAFCAFGSNLIGAGTFVSKTEASPYFQNMGGVQLTVSPKIPGYGHFRVKYGQHRQLKKARDLLYFPYRLNGMDLNSFILSTYTKWGVGTVDYPMAGVKYDRRLGDESYDPQLDMFDSLNDFAHLEEGPEKGGLHADYLSMFEGFVAYEDSLQVLYNILSRRGIIGSYREVGVGNIGRVITENGDTVTITNNSLKTDENAFLPMHKKYTFNFEVDAAYDIGPLIHYKNDFFLAGYAAINGVSTSLKAFAINEEDDDMLLWSVYLRFEPGIALTKKFYIGLLLGYENWRSNNAWMNFAIDPDPDNLNKEDLNNPIIKRVPINYTDAAYGIGFDWDMLDRVGLHGRFKWMTHKDEQISDNYYDAFMVSTEVTTFF